MPERYPNRFKPGQSGNPSGRPKRTQSEKNVIDQMWDLTPDAVDVLRKMLNSPRTPAAVRLKAAEIILDRTCGKPRIKTDAEIFLHDEDFVLKIVPDPEAVPYEVSGYHKVGDVVGEPL